MLQVKPEDRASSRVKKIKMAHTSNMIAIVTLKLKSIRPQTVVFLILGECQQTNPSVIFVYREGDFCNNYILVVNLFVRGCYTLLYLITCLCHHFFANYRFCNLSAKCILKQMIRTNLFACVALPGMTMSKFPVKTIDKGGRQSSSGFCSSCRPI